ncbi:murein hydrolase activator EnvC family protein [Variovorax ginsengisoli]|uniref:Lipoprotein NlpD n=1 Tax=Variovorax ginsengisoli TaxID=363844 RepID=A0ABT9S2H9_9BURK|nr:M23 family metallopeptidase [Variovorax ginsengisoli]MDP9898430.1 lipoprotein NlpD [Variovorax ginsengisoli]
MNQHIPPTVASRGVRAVAASLALAGLAACVSTPLPPMPPLRPLGSTDAPAPAPMPAPPRPVVTAPAAPPVVTGPRSFVPPVPGARVGRFNNDTNKGVDFAGNLGEPIHAARAGRVVLVSSALSTYGTMIVVKHDDDFITAYAQIGKALVKEGDEVQQGQPIAEMGRNATNNRVELHFEIRKQGTAVDPEPYLDGRMF